MIYPIYDEILSSGSAFDALSSVLSVYCDPAEASASASVLLSRFGSFAAVLEASPAELGAVVSPLMAKNISSFLPLIRRYERDRALNSEQIANRKDLERFCLSLVLGKRVEEFHVVCVNAQCRLLGTRLISSGSLSDVSAYPRLVVQAALDMNAHSVFFCHNHPGGTLAPSSEDIATTLQLQRLLSGLDILVLDHMIIAGSSAYSMAQHGDLEFGVRGRR